MDSMKNDSTHYVSDQIAEGPRTPRLPDECCENGKLGQLHNCKKNMATSPIIQNGWISIHDRMPEQGRWIAVALTDGQVLADYRGSLPFSKYVAYWQYLPEAPNVQSPCAATRETRGTPAHRERMRKDLARLMHSAYFAHPWHEEDRTGQELWLKVADSVLAYLEIAVSQPVAPPPQRETEIFWNVLTQEWECADCDWTDTAPASIVPEHNCRRCCDNGFFGEEHKCQKSNPVAAEPVAPGTSAEDDNELNKHGKEWLMLMREIVKLSDDEDELEADDDYLLAEFDPWHVLRRVIAERAAHAGTQPAQAEKN